MNLEIHNFTQNNLDCIFLKKIAEKTLEQAGIKDNIEISLAIVGDGRMRKINRIYQGKNRITDVLSFDNKEKKFIEMPDGVKRLGEIMICYPQAKKQARLAGYQLEKELAVLFIHGLLHLLGYDHKDNGKRTEEMRTMEDKILKKIN